MSYKKGDFIQSQGKKFIITGFDDNGWPMDINGVATNPEHCELLQDEADYLRQRVRELNLIIHNHIVTQQTAFIEWQRGAGAEKAMAWIDRGIADYKPQQGQKFSRNAKEWYALNTVTARPKYTH